MKRLFFGQSVGFLLCLALCAVSFSGCVPTSSQNSPSEATAKVFHLNLGTEPPDLDPAKIADLTSFTVVMALMKGLTQYDEQLKPIPAIAERWTRSPDGLHYVFNLRPTAHWSDGKTVVAEDFINAWQRALTPETASDYAFFLFEIKNGRRYYEGKLKSFTDVGVKALDSHTLSVDLERPTPFFLDLMAAPIAMPVRKDIIDRYGDSWTEAGHYVSNGPFQLQQWQHDELIRLTPNPQYYGKPSSLTSVDMVMINDPNTSVVMYENNALDFIETTTSIPAFDVRRLRKSPQSHVQQIHRINYLGFNTAKHPTDDPRVRQALGHAIDRRYFPKLLQSGQTPILSWISKGLLGYNPHVGLDFNPVKARQLLAEAGYPNGKGFPTITLGYRTSYDVQKECEILQYLWKKNLGINVELQNMEWKVYISQLRADPPHLFMMGWFVDYPDADSYMSMMASDSGNNSTRWKSKHYDQLIGEAVVTLDPVKRQHLYDQAQRLLLEQDTAIVPLYQSEKTYLVKPWVKNLKINALNLIMLDDLEIKK